MSRENREPQTVVEPTRSFHNSFLGISGITAAAAIVLVSVWGSSNRTNFLSIPDWNTNLFAWHPILMVGGFYFCQVFAILSWSLPAKTAFFSKSMKLALHIIFHMGALVSCIIALFAVFQSHNLATFPDLTSMHSWIGMAAACLFVTNYLLGLIGLVASALTNTTNPVQLVYVLKGIHRFLAMSSLTAATTAILAGIQLIEKETCANNVSALGQQIYAQLSAGCKISHGLGVVVVLCTLCCFGSVLSRYRFEHARYIREDEHRDAAAAAALSCHDEDISGSVSLTDSFMTGRPRELRDYNVVVDELVPEKILEESVPGRELKGAYVQC